MTERAEILKRVAEAQSVGATRAAAAEVLGISLRTLERWERDLRDDGRTSNRFVKSNALSAEERAHVVSVACSPEFRDLSPNQIVPILAENGVYVASESTFYRILDAEGLLTHRSRSRAPERSRPEEFVATAPNQVWTWDITPLRSLMKGVFFRLYLMLDIWDRSIVGWAVHEEERGAHAADLLHETCTKENVQEQNLVVHQDNGAPMISWEFLSALRFWGQPSYSRPGVCDDNPFSESMFKTLKYRPGFPSVFATIEEARAWVAEFVEWYNNHHRHSGIGYVTPMQRRRGEDLDILTRRRETYAAARMARPARWSGKTRSWSRPESVSLNPSHGRRDRRKVA